ncbi:MAG: hypothetical protein FJW38_17910, partial [Acidobacteria bacterium]|nr:hypothetical protein [Acidobacteriota bacterium]
MAREHEKRFVAPVVEFRNQDRAADVEIGLIEVQTIAGLFKARWLHEAATLHRPLAEQNATAAVQLIGAALLYDHDRAARGVPVFRRQHRR